MKRRNHSSFRWALQLEASEATVSELSEIEQAGLDYARELAEDHAQASAMPPWQRDYPPLTVEEIAGRGGLSTALVRARITRARRAFFGDLTDAAIDKRIQRQRGRGPRTCAHPSCSQRLAAAASANRRYCRDHGAVDERLKRHLTARA